MSKRLRIESGVQLVPNLSAAQASGPNYDARLTTQQQVAENRKWRKYALQAFRQHEEFARYHLKVDALPPGLVAAAAKFDLLELLNDKTGPVRVHEASDTPLLLTAEVAGEQYVMAFYFPPANGQQQQDHSTIIRQLADMTDWQVKRGGGFEQPFSMAGYRLQPTNGHPANIIGRFKPDTEGMSDTVANTIVDQVSDQALGWVRAWHDRINSGMRCLQQQAGKAARARMEAILSTSAGSSGSGSRSVGLPNPCGPVPQLGRTPATCVSATHNIHTPLHVDRHDHEAGSFIAWYDKLQEGEAIQGAVFWLTHKLVFAPASGSILYLDTRLLPHSTGHTEVVQVAGARRKKQRLVAGGSGSDGSSGGSSGSGSGGSSNGSDSSGGSSDSSSDPPSGRYGCAVYANRNILRAYANREVRQQLLELKDKVARRKELQAEKEQQQQQQQPGSAKGPATPKHKSS